MRVRIRQLIDELRHRLLVVPVAFVIGGIVLAQITLWIDRTVDDDSIPQVLSTTVESARSILTAIAGGLITAITLLLSMMLVAVQLASSQFSPRTVRNWIGDRTQQGAIGFVLGTTVYCLLVLRQTRTVTDGDPLTPNISVLVALVLGIGSLIAVVRSVDQLTNRLRIGSVASNILDETVATIERRERLMPIEDPAGGRPGGHQDGTESAPPSGAHPVLIDSSGWVQQIDVDTALVGIPEGSTLYLPLSVGAFAFPDAPIAWVWPVPMEPQMSEESVGRAIAVGTERTMQQDVGFGIVQMVDIALRALSPGVNDPNTASDLVAHLGVTMLKLWERPVAPTMQEMKGRTVVRRDLDHADYLHAAFDPVRIYGAQDPGVASTMIRTLQTLRAEVERRGLPGPTEPIDEVIGQILQAVDASELADFDKQRVAALVTS
ncbi:DUF2254 domain-containing protein [Ilumatobacter nonamiensis]|uniref:DUF2254 domain-containing protein n=1 Tax=Ilumatobacter nonamiensis TaxID=467093 RepID=UPI00130E8F70|nr:DUF2254 domain-containing protein [Ilumatobacter nonamiensis]